MESDNMNIIAVVNVDEQEQRPSTSPKQRPKSMIFMHKRSRSRSPPPLVRSKSKEQMLILLTIEDDLKRRAIINELVTTDFEDALLLRFYQACKEFKNQKDSKKMHCMGKKIVAMFIEKGSMHEVKKINPEVKKSLLKTKSFASATFDNAVDSALSALEGSQNVMDVVRRVSLSSKA